MWRPARELGIVLSMCIDRRDQRNPVHARVAIQRGALGVDTFGAWYIEFARGIEKIELRFYIKKLPAHDVPLRIFALAPGSARLAILPESGLQTNSHTVRGALPGHRL